MKSNHSTIFSGSNWSPRDLIRKVSSAVFMFISSVKGVGWTRFLWHPPVCTRSSRAMLRHTGDFVLFYKSLCLTRVYSALTTHPYCLPWVLPTPGDLGWLRTIWWSGWCPRITRMTGRVGAKVSEHNHISTQGQTFSTERGRYALRVCLTSIPFIHSISLLWGGQNPLVPK